jgi:Fur family ferric uptake transcriptional regulator
MQISRQEQIFREYLRKKELRVTRERLGIVKAIFELNTHFTVDSLYHLLKKRKSGISLATVYNSIDHLLEAGLIRRHRFNNHSFVYEAALEHRQHDHLICNDCGHVTEFCDPRIQHIQNMMGEILGFHITSHSLHLFGHCLLLKEKNHCPHFTSKK